MQDEMERITEEGTQTKKKEITPQAKKRLSISTKVSGPKNFYWSVNQIQYKAARGQHASLERK